MTTLNATDAALLAQALAGSAGDQGLTTVPTTIGGAANMGALGATFGNGNSAGFGMTPTTEPNGQGHANSDLQYPGEAVGGVIGAVYGAPGLGMMGGKNAGLTLGDALGGKFNNFGYDVSDNLPTGFQAQGWGGITNGLTGLPLANIFGIK
jgi:hypothetical protein